MFLRLLKAVELGLGVHGIHDRDDRIERVIRRDVVVDEKRLRDRCRIGQPGGLDDDAVEGLGPGLSALPQLAEDAHQVAANGAADAAVVHLDDLFVRVGDKQLVVDPRLAELVLDDGDALVVALAQNTVEQGRFSGTQKAGQDRHRNLATQRDEWRRHASVCTEPTEPMANRLASNCSCDVMPLSISSRSAAFSHCS